MLTLHDGGQSNRNNTNANDQDLKSQPDQNLQTPTWRDSSPIQWAMLSTTTSWGTSQNPATSQPQATPAPAMPHAQLVPGTNQPRQTSYPPQQMPPLTTWQQPAKAWTGIPNQQLGYGTTNQQTQQHEDLKKKYAELERELSLLQQQLTQQSQETQYQPQLSTKIPTTINVHSPPTDDQTKICQPETTQGANQTSKIPNPYIKTTRTAPPKVANIKKPPPPPPVRPPSTQPPVTKPASTPIPPTMQQPHQHHPTHTPQIPQKPTR